MKRIILFISIITIFIACNREEYTEIPFESKIVVEGWIEQGEVARVLLMHSVPLTALVDSSNYLKYVIRSATVIVSNGDVHDTLRLKTSSVHLPPFVYVGEKILGEEGKNYTLTVKYLDTVLTAESSIPTSVPINEVAYYKENPSDTVGRLSIRFTDPSEQQIYYQVATRVDKSEEIFIPALYGILDNRNFTSSEVDFRITRGITIFPETNVEAYFYDGDYVHVKLRTMSKEGFDFWNSWQYEIINAQNPLFPANKSLKGNIKGGGLGFWSGYGQDMRSITLR